MTNNRHLLQGHPDTQFRSGREAVENGRKGGVASGKARRQRRSFKEFLDMVGNLPLDSGRLTEPKTAKDLKGANLTLDEANILKLYAEARNGKLRAIDMLFRLQGRYAPAEMHITHNIEQMSEEDLDALIAKEQERK